MKIQKLIKRKPYLTWSVKDSENLSEDAIVEAVLNYGDFDDVKELLKSLGIKKVASIFRKQTKGPRCNYDPKIKHYFAMYFKKYA